MDSFGFVRGCDEIVISGGVNDNVFVTLCFLRFGFAVALSVVRVDRKPRSAAAHKLGCILGKISPDRRGLIASGENRYTSLSVNLPHIHQNT